MTLYYFFCGFVSKYSPRILHICSIIIYIFVICAQLIISNQHILTMGISLWVFLQFCWYSLDHGRLFSYPVAGALCPHWCRRWDQACHSPRLSTWAASTTQASCSSHYVSVWVLCIWRGFKGHTETKSVFFIYIYIYRLMFWAYIHLRKSNRNLKNTYCKHQIYKIKP